MPNAFSAEATFFWPIIPGKRYEDWVLEDPAGQGVAAVRPIRDEIEARVRDLLASLDIEARG